MSPDREKQVKFRLVKKIRKAYTIFMTQYPIIYLFPAIQNQYCDSAPDATFYFDADPRPDLLVNPTPAFLSLSTQIWMVCKKSTKNWTTLTQNTPCFMSKVGHALESGSRSSKIIQIPRDPDPKQLYHKSNISLGHRRQLCKKILRKKNARRFMRNKSNKVWYQNMEKEQVLILPQRLQ